jgi:predicted double-glycine peptidase
MAFDPLGIYGNTAQKFDPLGIYTGEPEPEEKQPIAEATFDPLGIYKKPVSPPTPAVDPSPIAPTSAPIGLATEEPIKPKPSKETPVKDESTMLKLARAERNIGKAILKGAAEVPSGLAAMVEKGPGLTGGMINWILPKTVREKIAKGLRYPSEIAPETEEPGFKKGVPAFLEQSFTGLAQSAVPMAAQYISPEAGVASIYAQMKGSKYNQLVEEGVPEKKAQIASDVHALLGTPIEFMGNLIAFKGLGNSFAGMITKTGMSKQLGRVLWGLLETGIGEGAEEYGQAYTELVADEYAKNYDKPAEKIISNIADKITSAEFQKQAGIQAAMGFTGGVTLGIGGAMAGGLAGQGEATNPPPTPKTESVDILKKEENKRKVTPPAQGLVTTIEQPEVDEAQPTRLTVQAVKDAYNKGDLNVDNLRKLRQFPQIAPEIANVIDTLIIRHEATTKPIDILEPKKAIEKPVLGLPTEPEVPEKAIIPEQTLLEGERYDKENIQGIPSEVIKGQKPIQTEPIQKAGGETIGPSGNVQGYGKTSGVGYEGVKPINAEEIASKLGIKYDGFQENLGPQWTDLETGTTFYTKNIDANEVAQRLSEKRKAFEVAENGISTEIPEAMITGGGIPAAEENTRRMLAANKEINQATKETEIKPSEAQKEAEVIVPKTEAQKTEEEAWSRLNEPSVKKGKSPSYKWDQTGLVYAPPSKTPARMVTLSQTESAKWKALNKLGTKAAIKERRAIERKALKRYAEQRDRVQHPELYREEAAKPKESQNVREWVSSRGGISNKSSFKGELSDLMQGSKKGWPKDFIREGGRDLDALTIEAIEDGILAPDSTDHDLYEAIVGNLSKEKYYENADNMDEKEIRRLEREAARAIEDYERGKKEDIDDGEYNESQIEAEEQRIREIAEIKAEIDTLTPEQQSFLFGEKPVEVVKPEIKSEPEVPIIPEAKPKKGRKGGPSIKKDTALFEKPEEEFKLTPSEPVSEEEKIAWGRMKGEIGRGEKTTIRPVIPTEAIPTGTGGKQETLFGPKETKKGETGDLFAEKKAEPEKPWEMTREEYRAELSRLWEETKNNDIYINLPFVQYSEKVPHEYFNESMKYESTTDQKHYRTIQQALRSGDLTPARYAELHEKDYGKLEEFMPEMQKEAKQPQQEAKPRATEAQPEEAIPEVKPKKGLRGVSLLKAEKSEPEVPKTEQLPDTNLFKQSDKESCGIACTQSILSMYGKETEGIDITFKKGVSPKAITQTLKENGISAESKTISIENVKPRSVAYYPKKDHYVTIESVEGDNLLINDPLKSEPEYLTRDQFYEKWKDKEGTGWVIETELATKSELAIPKKEGVGSVRLDKGGVKPVSKIEKITTGKYAKGIYKDQDLFNATLLNGKTVRVKREQIRTWPEGTGIKEAEGEYKGQVFEEGVDKIGESDVQYAYVPTENTQLALNFKPAEQQETGAIPPTQRVRMATTGYIKGAGNIVSGPGDVASLLASIRKSPQELLYTVTVDKDGVILEVHKAYKGGKAASVAYATEIAGRVLNIKDAAKTYLVHNHPSGDPTPSVEDNTVGSEAQRVLRAGDVELQSLIIGKNKYAIYSPSNYPARKAGYSEEYDIPKVLRKVLIPVKERKILIRSGQGKYISSSVAAEELFKSEEYGNQDGVLLIDRKNTVLAFMPFIKGQSMKQTTADISRLAESTNASSFIVNNNSDSENRMTYIEALKTGIADLKPLDIINNGKSMADEGLLRIAEKSGRGYEVRSEDLLSDRPVFLLNTDDNPFVRSLNAYKGPSLSRIGVEKSVDQFKTVFPNSGEIIVLQSQDIIPDATHRRAGLDPKKMRSGKQRIFGYFDPRTDTTYIVANNMKSRNMINSVLVHEIIGHRGVFAVLKGSERKEVFNLIKDAYADTEAGRKLIENYGLDLTKEKDQDTFSKELIARMAEKGENPSLMDKIIAFVKNALRRAMFELKISDAEIRALIGRSYEYSKIGGEEVAEEQPVFAMEKEPPPKTPAQAEEHLRKVSEKSRTLENGIVNNKLEKEVYSDETFYAFVDKYITGPGKLDTKRLQSDIGIVIEGEPNNPDDLKKWYRELYVMADMEKRYPKMKKLFDIDNQQRANNNLDNINDGEDTKPYFESGQESRDKIDKALVASDNQNAVIPNDQLASKYGLNENERKGYWSMIKKLDDKLKFIVQHDITTLLKQDTPVDIEAVVKAIWTYKRARFEGAVGKAHGKDLLRQKLTALGLGVGEITKIAEENGLADWAKNRHAYIPHTWNTKWVVKATDRNDKEFLFEIPDWKTYRPTNKQTEQAARDAARKIIEKEIGIYNLKKFTRQEIEAGQKKGKSVKSWHVIRSTDIPMEISDYLSSATLQSINEKAIGKIESEYLDRDDLTPEQKAEFDDIKTKLQQYTEEYYKAKGWGKHLIPRRNVKGYKTDNLAPILASYLYGINAWKNKGTAATQYAEAMRDIDPAREGNQWLTGRNFISDMLGTPGEVNWFKKIVGTWYLAADLSNAALNVTQNFTHALAMLRGIKTSGIAEKDITRAMKDILGAYGQSKVEGVSIINLESQHFITDKEKDFIANEFRKGGLDPQFFMETTTMRPHSLIYQHWLPETLMMPFKLFTGSEGWNRMSTLLAAYRRGTRAGIPREQLQEIASHIVKDSHWVYSRGNKPEIVRRTGKWGSAAYTFMNYPVQNIMWYKDRIMKIAKGGGDIGGMKTSRATEIKILGSNICYVLALGGTASFPFGWILKKIWNMLFDPDKDAELQIYEHTPKFVSRMVTKGIPAAFGLDMSRAVEGTDIFGAPIGYEVAKSMKRKIWDYTMIPIVKRGDWSALYHAAPDFVANPIKAFWGEKQGSGVEGNPPIKYTTSEKILKAGGFVPTRETETRNIRTLGMRKQQDRLDEVNKLAERYIQANKETDPAEKQRARAKIYADMIKWNQSLSDRSKSLKLTSKDYVTAAKRKETYRGKGYEERLPEYMDKYQQELGETFGVTP